jgi:hypothetical protein
MEALADEFESPVLGHILIPDAPRDMSAGTVGAAHPDAQYDS